MKKNKGKISLKLMSLLQINRSENIKEIAGSSTVDEETVKIKDTIVFRKKSIIIKEKYNFDNKIETVLELLKGNESKVIISGYEFADFQLVNDKLYFSRINKENLMENSVEEFVFNFEEEKLDHVEEINEEKIKKAIIDAINIKFAESYSIYRIRSAKLKRVYSRDDKCCIWFTVKLTDKNIRKENKITGVYCDDFSYVAEKDILNVSYDVDNTLNIIESKNEYEEEIIRIREGNIISKGSINLKNVMPKNKIELNKNFIIVSESIYVVNYLNGKILKYTIKGNKYEVEKNYNFAAEDFDKDIDGNIWAVKSFCGENIVYKLEGDQFIHQYRVNSDRCLLSVYDDKNIIISDRSEYSLISKNSIIA
ncbi:putative secreted protein [Clostridium bornimense]|uniref:Putative secreted protein n=1 Tax=Clostridium bornimense TaxID=1216932 RepID=W6SEB6_9CLOT|nr:hypothetical protein [Clostridium bornimense]CDM67980.1 putative secreted protein [Clostridium bornimense]